MNTTNKRGAFFGSVWDERQQQSYHHINSKAYNMTWFLLLASILLQVLLYPREPARWLVEIGLFLLLNLYTTVAYLRAGLWTKTQQTPGARQNILASFIAALLVTALSLLRMALSGHARTLTILGQHLSFPFLLFIQAVLVFACAVGILSLLAWYHRRKKQQMDASLEEDA